MDTDPGDPDRYVLNLYQGGIGLPDESYYSDAAHADVLPGWHMNKKHWVSVVLHPDLDPELLEQLVEDAYDLVVSGLPRSRRPMTH